MRAFTLIILQVQYCHKDVKIPPFCALQGLPYTLSCSSGEGMCSLPSEGHTCFFAASLVHFQPCSTTPWSHWRQARNLNFLFTLSLLAMRPTKTPESHRRCWVLCLPKWGALNVGKTLFVQLYTCVSSAVVFLLLLLLLLLFSLQIPKLREINLQECVSLKRLSCLGRKEPTSPKMNMGSLKQCMPSPRSHLLPFPQKQHVSRVSTIGKGKSRHWHGWSFRPMIM